MGWWKVQDTEHLIGDEPLEALGSAISDVISEYRAEFDRRPTKAEWEALLFAVLGAEDREQRPIDDGVVTEVRIETDSDKTRAR